ncbi:hypothetical protein SLA2020_052830 [Shorea laevis]
MMVGGRDLPDDLTKDIIGQLSDPKSLCRFKSVSKSWCSLISEIKGAVLVFVGVARHTVDTVYSADLDCSTSSLTEHPVPDVILEGGNLSIRGTCNGLIVFKTGETFFIWSKFIGDFQVITSKPRCYAHGDWDEFGRTEVVLYGFGYDSVNEDYKLVDIMGFHHGRKIKVSTYSFRNNTWSRRSPLITDKTSPPTPYFDIGACGCSQTQGVLVGSLLNWVAYRDSRFNTPPFIFAFNLTTEEFHEIELPEIDTASVLGVLEGCLTVTHPKANHSSKSVELDIWVMKEYMVKESWTLAFRILVSNRGRLHMDHYRRDYCRTRPLAAACSRNGNTKILLASGSLLLWYDPENDKLDAASLNIEDKNIRETIICFWPTTYVVDWQSISRFLSSNREEESIWKRKGPVAFCHATQN